MVWKRTYAGPIAVAAARAVMTRLKKETYATVQMGSGAELVAHA